MKWVGFQNYQDIFVTDTEFVPRFLEVVRDLPINTALIVILSLLIAIMISREIKARGFFRSVFFLPVLLGTGFVMQEVLGQGVDQQAMEVARGILLPTEVQNFIGADVTGYVMGFFDRVTVVLWKSGVQIVIALAGLQGIAPSLYESARIDGATEWEMFWKITLPMILPILLLNIIYTVIAFMTESNRLMEYIKDKVLLEMQYSAAMGWVYFAFILLFVGLVFAVMRPAIKKANV